MDVITFFNIKYNKFEYVPSGDFMIRGNLISKLQDA